MSNAKLTQNYKLWTLLSGGEVVTKETIAKTLDIADVSVAVYIYDLRKKFKAQIQNINAPLAPGARGRGKVVAYRLVNKINVPKFRTNNNIVEKVAQTDENSAAVPVLDKDVGGIDDREMADIRSSLGIGDLGE